MAVRGTPNLIISDNAQHFKLANSVLDKIWKGYETDTELHSYIKTTNIAWKFNIPMAPWMGGFYERLIGSVKRSLKKTIGQTLLTLIELQTLIKEIEAILNSRPLTYISNQTDDTILTPSNFLGSGAEKLCFPTIYNDDDEYKPTTTSKDNLIILWRKGQNLLNNYWKAWKSDYLLNLRERNDTKHFRNSCNELPKVGNIVIIKDANTPRAHWKLGKIVKLNISNDNLIRSIKLKLGNKRFVDRSIQQLIPLEF